VTGAAVSELASPGAVIVVDQSSIQIRQAVNYTTLDGKRALQGAHAELTAVR